ncbi:uncharacterized protein [Palaemon carinicauda]|uniref:uncharacterized protein n=1 Tax=Palaemon carinicauda TaxID=392227 RepID=UPI0035B5FADE
MDSFGNYYGVVILLGLASIVACVGPRPRNNFESPATKEVDSYNVAILEELRTITNLVLRNQNKEDPVNVNVPVVHDCSTLREAGIRASGVYSLFPFTFKVYCDMETDGGGWTVIQRRVPVETHEAFNRSWSDYKRGFGDMYGEFWLGLEALHQLTYSWPHELRIDMVDYEYGPKHALYKTVSVGPESDGYRLRVSNYSGNAGDALSLFHSGRRFSTLDKDQDLSRNKSCAREKLVEKLYAFIANSSKWYAAFMYIPKAMYPEERPLELKKLSDTRWACRESALRTMRKVIPALKQFLEEIVQKHPPGASAGDGSILLQSINFEFLEIPTTVFQKTAYASNALQQNDFDWLPPTELWMECYKPQNTAATMLNLMKENYVQEILPLMLELLTMYATLPVTRHNCNSGKDLLQTQAGEDKAKQPVQENNNRMNRMYIVKKCSNVNTAEIWTILEGYSVECRPPPQQLISQP